MNLTDDILESINRLPPFPVVIQKTIQLIDDPTSSAQDVVDVIQYDQSITASVLKVCNSAYFGLRRTIHSLKEALVMIGFNQLLEIILGQESLHLLYASYQGYDLGEGELWRHSVSAALLSKIISQRLNRGVTPTHFTAALLHDIGKVAMNKFVKDYFVEIEKLVENQRLSFLEAEREILGIDHAELGGRITEQWNFPKSIVSAIRYHHTPFLAPEDHEIVQLVYLSDLVAILTGIGGGADGLSYHGYKEVMQQSGLREKDIEGFIVQLNEQFELVKEIINAKDNVKMVNASEGSMG